MRGINFKRNTQSFDWPLFFAILKVLNDRPEVPVVDACIEMGMPYAAFLRKINRIETIFIKRLSVFSKGEVTIGNLLSLVGYIDNRRIVRKKRLNKDVRIKL
jgi:hypothetical protein